MKKTILMIAMATLCLFFKAQSQNTAIDVVSKGIQVGQKIPNVVLNQIHNYNTSTAKISDFEGKLLILDFWATWCSPCIAMRPKMEVLQQQFDGKVQFISLTYEQPQIVLPFLQKLSKGEKGKVPDVMGEQTLHKLFPHIYLPHYVWVDQHGMVKAITGMEEVTAGNISKLLEGDIKLPMKRDMKTEHDEAKPFLVGNNGGDGRSLIYHSVFTGYIEGLQSGYRKFMADSVKGKKIVATNLSLLDLYSLAYGAGKMFFGANKQKFKSVDKKDFIVDMEGEQFDNWLKSGNGFCYELQVPIAASDDLYNYMQEDLKRLFPRYSASVIKSEMDCLALVRTSDKDKLKSKKGKAKIAFNAQGCTLVNFPLEHLVLQLNVIYMQHSKKPIINDTGYNSWVDLYLNANLSDLNAVNDALAKYDLKIIEKKLLIDMLEITTAKTKSLN